MYGGPGAPAPPVGGYGSYSSPPVPGGYGSPAPPGGASPYGVGGPGGYGASPAPYGSSPYGSSPYGAPAGAYGASSGGYGGSYGGGGGGYGGAPVPTAAAGYGGYSRNDPSDYKRPFHMGGQHVLGKDRCPFYHKMGACRHGDRCTKVHDKPTSSKTIILPMMYPNPKVVPLTIVKHGKPAAIEYDKKMLKKHIERFYDDVFCTVMEFGRIVEMRVVDNLCEHLLGNVYIKFEDAVAAMNAVDGLTGKMYNGILLLPELCPVSDFADAICKEVDDATCKRGIQCNYWHPTPYPHPDSSLLRDLARKQDKHWSKLEKKGEGKRDRSPGGRDRSPDRRDYRREGGDEGARLCYVCGRTGHLGKDCPDKE